MNYNVREGIVLTSVCGQNMLVACSAARKYVPYTLEINETAAFLWRMIEKGLSKEEMTDRLFEEYEISDDIDISKTIDHFIQFLCTNGYILAGDQDNA